MVRHAETEWNAGGRLQGHSDTPLNDVGMRQAASLRARMQEIQPTGLYSSDLSRCVQTARAALGLGPEGNEMDTISISRAGLAHPALCEIRKDLRERCFGEWEGMTGAGIAERYPEEHQAWITRVPGFCPPGAETRRQVVDRVKAMLEEVVRRDPGGRIVLFTHGGVISAAISYIFGAPPTPTLRVRLDNAGLTTLRKRHDRWELVRLNDVCHLGGA